MGIASNKAFLVPGRVKVKKAFGLLNLLMLLLLPLACVQRAFQSPVNPQIVSTTATPTPTVASAAYLICTITPTTTPVVMIESEPSTVTGVNDSFGTAQSLGTLGTQDVFLSGNLGGMLASPDNDYYSFVAGVSGTWTIYLDCYMSSPLPLIYVYDQTQALVGTYDQDPNWVVTFSAVSGQTYYLRVYGYGGNSYTAKIFHP